MADVPVPSIVTATPDGDDTVLGVKDGLVKRFSLDNVGAGINFSAINATTNMVFNTNGTEKMRIDSNGNVGIGYAAPEYKLEVNGEARFFGATGGGYGGQFRVYNTSAGATNPFKHFRLNSTGGWEIINSAYDAIKFLFTDDGTFTAYGDIRSPIFYDVSNTAYYLDPANTGTSMVVAGNVGIGTTSPGAKLTVAAPEAIRMADASPYLSFYNSAQSVRFGYAQHNGTNLALVNEQAGSLELYTSNTLRATLDASGNLIQSVNTTAATLGTNNTMTFSIVDNSTLRVSVRGSDGVTRTATIALS